MVCIQGHLTVGVTQNVALLGSRLILVPEDLVPVESRWDVRLQVAGWDIQRLRK